MDEPETKPDRGIVGVMNPVTEFTGFVELFE
jgi:hypothetical protein